VKSLWNKIKRIPAAVAAAVAAGVAILLLYLRGRRLEAELARSRVREEAARAKAHAAEQWGKRAIYEKKADQAAAEARELEKEARRIQEEDLAARKRLDGLTNEEIQKEYEELAERAKRRARQ
jgi:hypothetical protein